MGDTAAGAFTAAQLRELKRRALELLRDQLTEDLDDLVDDAMRAAVRKWDAEQAPLMAVSAYQRDAIADALQARIDQQLAAVPLDADTLMIRRLLRFLRRVDGLVLHTVREGEQGSMSEADYLYAAELEGIADRAAWGATLLTDEFRDFARRFLPELRNGPRREPRKVLPPLKPWRQWLRGHLRRLLARVEAS